MYNIRVHVYLSYTWIHVYPIWTVINPNKYRPLNKLDCHRQVMCTYGIDEIQYHGLSPPFVLSSRITSSTSVKQTKPRGHLRAVNNTRVTWNIDDFNDFIRKCFSFPQNELICDQWMTWPYQWLWLAQSIIFFKLILDECAHLLVDSSWTYAVVNFLTADESS